MNLHQNVLNSIKTTDSKPNSIVSPSSPSAMSSSSVSSSSSSSLTSITSNTSSISAAVAAVQAILQQQNSSSFNNNSSLAAAMQAAVNCFNIPKITKNQNFKDLSKLNNDVKNCKLNENNAYNNLLHTNQNLQVSYYNKEDSSLIENNEIDTPSKNHNQSEKINNMKKKKELLLSESDEKNNLISNAAALMAFLHGDNSFNAIQNEKSEIKNKRGSSIITNKSRMNRIKTISPNSNGASNYSDDNVSETLSSDTQSFKNESNILNENNKRNLSIQNEYENRENHSIEIKNLQESGHNESGYNRLYEAEQFYSEYKNKNKPDESSLCSPVRSISSQDQSRSISPTNSDYQHDSLTNSTVDINSPYSNINGIDSATLLAAQSLLKQQNTINCTTQSAVTNTTTDINSLSFLSDAATAALLAGSQPNSVASLVASRKRRNDKELNERIKKIKSVPDDKKDDAYWERRRKNNDAAKRSRDLRRQKEDEIANRASFLEQENLKLKAQITILKAELSKLHFMLYNR
jgi:hypothetical protein